MQKKFNDIEFMTDTSGAVLEDAPYSANIILWCAALFFSIAILWAKYATIDEITRGEGRVIASTELQTVQNLEGGILKKLLVKEGDIVEKNQIVMVIDDTRFSSTYKENKIKAQALRAKIIRLQAEASGQKLPVQISGEERSLFMRRQDTLLVKIRILQDDIIAKKQGLAALKRQRQQVAKSYELINKEIKLTQPLIADGAVSKVEVLRLDRQANDLKGELDGIKLGIPRLDAELSAAMRRVEETKAIFMADAQERLTNAKTEISTLVETSLALADRVDRAVVRSPVYGTVNEIYIKTIGGIIQPGENVVDIVPLDDTLLIEAEIKPQDIGFIRPGLKTKVKLTAYDFAIYGGLDGEVVTISADTVLNERQEYVYQIRILTDKNNLTRGNKSFPIITGMRASVDILTGKKTILQYLLKPILRGKEQALTER